MAFPFYRPQGTAQRICPIDNLMEKKRSVEGDVSDPAY